MIRIDEIYHHTFWPWIRSNRAGTRVYYCDPFGRSDADSVVNQGVDDIREHNYIFFFDQEPIHLNLHMPTFEEVRHVRNPDIHRNFRKSALGYLVTSERDSDTVDQICAQYQWQPLYYFFHGWAALDWYRGYDRTFLITPPEQRTITQTFLAPNRIIAGERRHRLEMLYWIFKLDLAHNHVSCPKTCPAENIAILDAVQPLEALYPDIVDVFQSQSLPRNFKGETEHPMHSCWLSLFDQSAESLLYLVTETVATGRRHHLTEKTFKPIAMGMPFIIVGTQGSLQYLRSYGFQTFGDLWDESYDNEPDDHLRIEKIAKVLQQLETSDRQAIFESAQAIVQHNWNHFYGGGFEAVLWQELQDMLNGIESGSGQNPAW
jgi:hypothetical protein